MNKFEDVDADALRGALADTTDPKTAKRLMIALAYDEGVPVETLSERYGIARSTVYLWLNRFEKYSLADAVHDDPRPGRSAILNENQQRELSEALQQRPTAFGLERDSWSPELVQEIFGESTGFRTHSGTFDG